MNPRAQSAGTAGIVAGIALAIVFFIFFTGRITPDMLSDPAQALPFVRERGGQLRTIAFFGTATAALATIFVAGLAAKLASKTPTRAVATLYFGILGVVGHGIGGLAFWHGVPMFQSVGDPVAAAHAWGAFIAVGNGLDGFGNTFIGLSLLSAGWAILSEKALPTALGWVGVIGGAATVLLVLVREAPAPVFLLSIALTVAFLIWAGSELRKGK